MRNRAATETDLDLIWPNLAWRMVEEYRLAEVTHDEAQASFRGWILGGRAVAICDAADMPVAIMAWEPTDDALATSFAATEAFFHPTLTLPFAHFVHRWQRANGNLPLVSYSYSPVSKTPKWFKAMGFILIEEDGVRRVFILPPSKRRLP